MQRAANITMRHWIGEPNLMCRISADLLAMLPPEAALVMS
jgi:hypothetical protein